MTARVTALVGVRGGSQRVPSKNSRPFADSNLLAIKIATLQQVPGINRVVVNSECMELLSIAKACGAETVIRDPFFASSTISTSDYYVNIAENCDADIILSATATTPLFRPASYQSGIDAFAEAEQNGFDSVTSCSAVREFLYRDGKALNYDPANQCPSQDLPNIQSLNYGFSIIRRDNMIRYRNIVGHNALLVQTEKLESIDIDTEEDFRMAEILYREFRLFDNAVDRAA